MIERLREWWFERRHSREIRRRLGLLDPKTKERLRQRVNAAITEDEE